MEKANEKMKNLIKSLAFLILLLFSSVVKAGSLNDATMYYGVHYYSYIERTTEHDPFMELQSQMPTFTLGIRDERAIRSENSTNKFSYFAEGQIGRVNYSNHLGTSSHAHNYWVLQTEGVYALPLNFYAGVGFRHLKDYLSAGGEGGYDRQNQLLYMPVGYTIKKPDDSSIKLQYNILMEGTQFSELSQIKGYGDLTNEQNEGYGLDLSYVLPGGGMELFGKYWNIADSTTNTSTGTKWIITGMEPLNETFEIGIKFAY